ncbi:N-acetylmuramoyl-L-alanine amidase [Micromonospora sp. DT233]|uniref:N-acetylmuramoyl-L-alanine amidase n=1 Tax=Micromonospora sp. DT233 TaxID=3393432 RepID=UPI003CEE8648
MQRPVMPASRRILLAAAVAATTALVPLGTAAAPAAADQALTRQQQYAAAAAEFGVPESVLLGVSFLQSRWDTNAGTPSTGAGYGPMHLTDAAYVTALPGGTHHDAGTEDPRGDSARRTLAPAPPQADPAPSTQSLQTLDTAATLTGADEAALRSDTSTNIRGGAALLASYQRQIGAPVGAGTDPAAWYGAVARYSGAERTDAAAAFADEVFGTIAQGESRVTDDGQRVTLAGRAVRPQKSWLDLLGLLAPPRADGVECPSAISCEWIPAPYQDLGGGDYGNHDLANRSKQQKVEYILIHDTEGSYAGTVNMVQDPTYVSWHYTLRSSDGHIAQHVKTKDVAWHAGNWYVNSKSIGLEHEGFAAQGTWYTEAMYRTSSKLVRYLALRHGVPLDRAHIIGHDNVPGILPANVGGMHWDPGPYWDWSHYFDLLRAPELNTGTPLTGMVRIDPDFTTNRPAFTGCDTAGVPCPSRGSSSVVLRSAPSADAPLVNDIALRPDGSPATMHISDHGARASTGQTYALAGRSGDWTAIWYLGQKAWFHNPASAPTAKWTLGLVATPKAGKTTIPVYGRAYPEEAAYPEGVPYQPITPLQYTLSAGQRYSVGAVLPGEYYRAVSFDGSAPADRTVIKGDKKYVQIQFGHRIMYVDRADVDLVASPLGAPR